MSDETLFSIFKSVQTTAANHQKYIRVLTKFYHKTPFDEFYDTFINILLKSFTYSAENNLYVQRILTFAAKFCADIAKKEEDDNDTHPLLFRTLHQIFEYTDCAVVETRYNTCKFVMLILQYIKDGVSLDNDLCDDICKHMLPRLQDPRVDIRMQAISSLVRLQEPANPECPVVHAFIRAMTDTNTKVRREAIKSIAPAPSTLPKIKQHISDIDGTIRAAAFQRCGDFGPTNFRIADRHLILMRGFQEEVESVRNTFAECLLAKWLTAYKGSHLDFLHALKLSPREEDLDDLVYIAERLLNTFVKRKSLDDVLDELPIENRSVPQNLLTDIMALYWKICADILRESDPEEKLELIVPDLTAFCEYIKGIIGSQSQKMMDEWQIMEYQFILLNLFQIANGYDLSDEVGRRNLHTLVLSLLPVHNFNRKLIKVLVEIAEKCSADVDGFTLNMCEIISDIQEGEVEQRPPAMSEYKRREHEFEIGKLEVHQMYLKDKQSEALKKEDYQHANEIELELLKTRRKLEEMREPEKGEVVKVTKDDSKTITWCLNILMSVLELPNVKNLSPALATVKMEFLVPLIQKPDIDVHWRVLSCLTAMALIDRVTAEQYGKILCIPIATYRTLPCNDTQALTESIYAVSDLMLMYGSSIICDDESAALSTTNHSKSKRRLYNSDEDVSEGPSQGSMTMSMVYGMFMDLMDAEDGQIRERAAAAMSKLILGGFAVSSSILSRMILKWCIPAKSQEDKPLQIILGGFFQRYVAIKTNMSVFQEAMIPTLTILNRAPKPSPLVDIDVDNILRFFSSVLTVHGKHAHGRIMAFDILMKIEENVEDPVVQTLVKFLDLLQFPRDNPEAIAEITTKAEELLEDNLNQFSRKKLQKFIFKMKGLSTTVSTNASVLNEARSKNSLSEVNSEANSIASASRRNSTDGTNTAGGKENVQRESKRKSTVENGNRPKRRNGSMSTRSSARLSSIPQAESTTVDKPTNSSKAGPEQVKRRKGRNHGKDLQPYIVLEKFHASHSNDTALHTIIETSMEKMNLQDDDMTIQTPSTNTPVDSPMRNVTRKVVISDTSDTDSVSNGSGSTRRSQRLRKKRIIQG